LSEGKNVYTRLMKQGVIEVDECVLI
jgi:hypothetical protein